MSKIVDRTMDVFELFAMQKRPLSLSELTRLLKIPISSCHDVVRALEARGYIYETASRAGYYPTMRLHNLCKVIVEHDPLIQRAEAVIERVRDELDESTALAKATGMTVTYLLVLESTHPLRYSVTAGTQLRSCHATSTGKALLGSLSEAAFDEYLKSAQLNPLTEKSITSKTKLRADIEQGRKRGWFLNREESVIGALTISSAFKWNNGLYMVTVAGPLARMEAKLEDAAQSVLQACRELSGQA